MTTTAEQTKPLTKKAQKAADRAEAITKLRAILKPGDTVYCVLEHVSRSGMRRRINFYGPENIFLTGYIAKALDMNRPMRDRSGRMIDGLVVDGCGMDMGFSVVYDLSSVLFRAGFGCIGEGCPSSDHSNGDRDYTPHYDGTPRNTAEVGKDLTPYRHYHESGGYALKHRWL